MSSKECERCALFNACTLRDVRSTCIHFIEVEGAVQIDYKQFDKLGELAHEIAIEKGWWDNGYRALNCNDKLDIPSGIFDSNGKSMKMSEVLEALNGRRDGELIALIHSEPSEALEGLRHGNGPSDKIPEFNAAEEELADTVIRIADMCAARGWRLGEAIEAKIEYNQGRSHRHGGKKF